MLTQLAPGGSVSSRGGFHRLFASKAARSEIHKQNGCRWQPWFYSGLVAHCCIGLSEGPTVTLRLGARMHAEPTYVFETHPRTQVSQNRTRHRREKIPWMERNRVEGHSSCLWLQIFGVERDS